QRARIDQIQALFTRWKAEVAAPEIAARRASPSGLAQAAQRAYVLVLQMRETAGAYAAGRDPGAFTQWIAEAADLRNRLDVLTVMEQSSTQVAAVGRAYALADQGARFGPGTPAARLVETGGQLDQIVSAIQADAQGADERLRQLTGAGTGLAIVDQIRAINLAFVDTSQANLRANLAATQRTARDARIVATAVPLALVLLLIAAMLASTGVTASIHEVAEAAAALAGGDFSRRVRAGGTDELGAMARAYNAMADRMRAQSQEAGLLGQMSDLLQASLSIDEACGVIARTVPRLFPGCGGSIYLASPSRDVLESVVSWGDGGGGGASAFALEDCWALRRGQPHYFGHDSTDARCRHLADAPAAASLCVPLMAQGDASGVLCLVDSAPAPLPRVFSEDEIRLARTVADQVGLAIANLRLRDTLRHQSIRDPLTGLYNRRYLEETLERELRRAERAGQSLGVLMFDIDLFKQFNDTFGHEAGDVMLREVGRLLRDRFRREDIVCRYGGEEFVIVLPTATL
ncbi:MAG TPA: diguanylate cyclase, partial [bacterium]|nr:diguanylate cyclase [bacterium]